VTESSRADGRLNHSSWIASSAVTAAMAYTAWKASTEEGSRLTTPITLKPAMTTTMTADAR
jgi:hypothetical protein